MPGPHSGPYESQHPNATEFEKLQQAGEILARLGMGQSTRKVAAAMGMSRMTMYERIMLISGPLPDLEALRVIHYERLEEMLTGLQERLDSQPSDADYVRLRAEQRQVLARQSALLGGDAPTRSQAVVTNDRSGPPAPEILGLIADMEVQRARDDDPS